MYLDINEINKIQLDHTSRCNLACPQCARMINGKTVNPSMPITDLTLDDYKILLEPFNKNKITLFHCGNYGDALASSTFDETFNYSLEKNVKHIRIATNGSLRNTEWWSELANRGGNRLSVIFSIDGLEETNPMYRVNSNFNKIKENAQAFINAGGTAEWAFIEFKHNYHQIAQAEQLAKDMGFSKFTAKYTSRFADQDQTTQENKKGIIVEDTADNQNVKDKKEITQQYNSFDEYVEQTPITCKYQRDKTVFVDMCMKLWPCCWLGAPEYFHKPTQQTKSFDHLFNIYGKDFNDMRKYGWQVFEHEFFQEYLDKSWNEQDNKFKRIYTCGRTCGEKFEFSSGHGKNIKSEIINDK
tara:strand:+ start:8163 stop:9230 length:1068 start_codon:yes stop_codon:yes gene_type:complete